MGFPKKIKKHLPLTPQKTLIGRREELLEDINRDGTYLPKSVLHADLDGGFLDFVKDELETIIEGVKVPVIDIIITTQNWSQFTETWNFQNIDKNVELPFITIVRNPEVKFGTNPALLYNIPNRRQYYYASVPTWDGQRKGMDIYKIPQPVPVDITYSVKILCNRMRELNKFNQIVLEKFASRQAYTRVKGHYIPIINTNISDESVMDVDKRKFYIQSYDFTLMGFLIDEDEFEISPAISRALTLIETDTVTTRRPRKVYPENPNQFDVDVLFVTGNTVVNELFNYKVDLTLLKTDNIESYDIFINNDYYGSDLSEIKINTNDSLRVEVVKTDNNLESSVKFLATLV